MVGGVEEHQLSGGQLVLFAGGAIGGEHVRVALFEFQGDALAHHAHGVDGVDDDLGGAVENISFQIGEHDVPSFY